MRHIESLDMDQDGLDRLEIPGKPAPENSTGSFALRAVLVLLLSLAALAGAYFGAQWYYGDRSRLAISGAMVRGEPVDIGSSGAGQITGIEVREGDSVQAGQIIARLSEQEARARLSAASAKVETLEGELRKAESETAAGRSGLPREIEQLAGALEAARARLKDLQAEARDMHSRSPFERSEDRNRITYGVRPFRPGMGGPDSRDSALAQQQVNEAARRVRELEAKLEAARAERGEPGSARQRIELLKARLDEARAALSTARDSVVATVLTSSVAGIVERLAVRSGDAVAPGQLVAVVVDLDRTWIEARLDPSRLQDIHTGQVVDLRLDAYPGEVFTGTIAQIGDSTAGPDSAGALPASPPGGTAKAGAGKGALVKIKPVDVGPKLKPGMIVTVTIDTQRAANTSVTGSASR